MSCRAALTTRREQLTVTVAVGRIARAWGLEPEQPIKANGLEEFVKTYRDRGPKVGLDMLWNGTSLCLMKKTDTYSLLLQAWRKKEKGNEDLLCLTVTVGKNQVLRLWWNFRKGVATVTSDSPEPIDDSPEWTRVLLAALDAVHEITVRLIDSRPLHEHDTPTGRTYDYFEEVLVAGRQPASEPAAA